MHNKDLARKWFDSVWNQKNLGAIAEMMDPAVAGLTEGGEIRGPEAFRTLVFEPMLQAFPDAKISVDRIIGEGDELAVRWTFVGTHDGPMAGIPPSGKRVKISGMTWLEIKEGKIVAGADSYNLHGLIAFLSGGPGSATVRAA